MRGEGATEVNEDLSKFRREHADFGVTGGAGLVTGGIGGDVLNATSEIPVMIKAEEFVMPRFFAELIMMAGGGREGGSGTKEEASATTLASEDFFEFHGKVFGGGGGGLGGVIGNTEDKLAGGVE